MKYLLVLSCILLASAQAGRLHNRKGSGRRLPNPPTCANIQSFERGYKYTYTYDAIIESVDDASNPVNGVRLRCNDVKIIVPSACVGVLRISDCDVFESRLLSNGSLAYDVSSPTSRAVHKSLRRSDVFFHFDQGQVGNMFISRSEPTDVSNIKRGILSAVQLKFTGLGIRTPLHTKTTVNEVSVLGRGPVDQIVTSYREGYGKAVHVERLPSKLNVPWSRTQWGGIHTMYDEDFNLVDMITDKIVENAPQYFNNGNQSCDYKLERGRHVIETRCVEIQPYSSQSAMFRKVYDALNLPQRYHLTVIKLTVKQTNDDRMRSTDRVPIPKAFQKTYRQDSLMYEEQWNETMSGMTFDPVSTFRDVIMMPANRSAAVWLSKLSRYIALSTEESITSLWNSVRPLCTSDVLLQRATNIWIRLLTQCARDNWCPKRDCPTAQMCQNILSRFISPSEIPSWSTAFEQGVLDGLGNIPNPNSSIIETTLSICRAKPTMATVLTLGKVLARHVEVCEFENEEPIVAQAVVYLKSLISNQCNIPSGQPAAQYQSLMIAAMKSIAAIPAEGLPAVNDLIACARNPRSSRDVALAAMQALKDMPLENQSQARVAIMRLLSDPSQPIAVRIAAYLLVITKDPSQAEIEECIRLAMSETEQRGLKFYITEHLKSEIQLRRTSFSNLPQSVVTMIWQVARRQHMTAILGNSRITEKSYSQVKEVFVPYLNRNVNFSMQANVAFADNKMIPALANITVVAQMNGLNITVLQAVLDLQRMMSIVQPLFGNNGLLPDQSIDALLQIPISQLLVTRNNLDLIPQAELAELKKIQDKAWMAYNILAFQSKPALEVSVMGIPLPVEYLTRIPSMKNLNIFNMWKIIDMLEKGWAYKAVEFIQWVDVNMAFPTTVGLPRVMGCNVPYYHDIDMDLMVQAKQIFLTGSGRINLGMKAVIQSPTVCSNRVQLPYGASSGTGFQLTTTHNSYVNGSIVTTPNSIVAHFEPLPQTTELFRIKVQPVEARSGSLVITTPERTCPKQCIMGNCDSGNGIYYTACGEPIWDAGLYIQSAAMNHYQVSTTWGSMQSIVNGEVTPSRGINVQLSRQSDHQAQFTGLVNITAAYIPTIGEIRCEVAMNGNSPWVVASNAAIYRSPSMTSQIEGLLTSVNVTNPSGRIVSSNIISIKRNQAHRSEFFSYFFHETEDTHKYVVSSSLQLPTVGDITASGYIQLKPDYSGYVAAVNVNQPMGKLCAINISGVEVATNNNAGYKTKISVNDITKTSFPYSRLSMAYTTTNDSTRILHQDMHIEATRRSNNEPHYFNTRFDLAAQSQSTPPPFVWKATTTINTAQIQWDMSSHNSSHLDLQQRIILTKQGIPVSMMSPQEQDQVRITEDHPTLRPNTYKARVLLNQQKDLDTIASVTAGSVIHDSIYGLAAPQTTNYGVKVAHWPQQCSRCHSIHVSLPLITISEQIDHKDKYRTYSAMVDAHHSMLDYARMSPKMLHMVKSNAIKNNRLKVGYSSGLKYDSHSLHGNFGLNFGDGYFNAVTSILAPEIPYFHAVLNTTCHNCIPIIPAKFKYNFGVVHESSQLTDVPEFSQCRKVRLDSSFIHAGGIEYNISSDWVTAYQDNVLVKAEIGVVSSYSATNPLLYFYYPRSSYRYSANAAAVLLDQTNIQDKSQHRYRISVKGGIFPDSPQWVGYFSNGRIASETNPSQCRPHLRCYQNVLELVQTTQCPNFTEYYNSKGMPQKYSTQNCSTLRIESINSADGFNYSLRFDGRQNADSWINRLVFVAGSDFRRGKDLQLYIEQAKASQYLPAQLGLNITFNGARSHSVVLDTDMARFDYSMTPEASRASLTTRNSPLLINCEAEVLPRQGITINIPTCTVAHPTTGPMSIRMRMNYEMLTANSLLLQINRNNVPAFAIDLRSSAPSFDYKVVCGNENDPTSPCLIRTQLDQTSLRWQSRVNTIIMNHTATATIPRNADIGGLNVETRSSIQTPMFVEPVVLAATAQYPQSQGLLLDLTCNSSNILTNVLQVRNGRLTTIMMEGRSIYIAPLSYTYSWMNRMRFMNGDIDIKSTWSLNNQTNLTMAVYTGPNAPSATIQVPDASPTNYLQAFNFGLTSCNGQAIVSMINQFRDRNSALLKTNISTSINMWPFVSEVGISKLLSPIWPCEMCLGEIEGALVFDATNPSSKQASIHIMTSRTSLWTMSYSMGSRPDQASFVSASTEWKANVGRTTTPHILFSTTVETLQGQRYMLQTRALSQNMGAYSGCLNETFSQVVGQRLQNEIEIQSEILSLKNLLIWGNDESRIMLRTPNTEAASLGMDITFHGDEMVVRDVRIMGINLQRMNVALVRNDLGQLTGLNMRDLTLTITPMNCDLVTITGHASLVLGGPCDIAIQDSTAKIVKIVVTAHPGSVWELQANVLVNLPTIRHELLYNFMMSDTQYVENLNTSLMMMNKASSKMAPIMLVDYETMLNKDATAQMWLGSFNSSVMMWTSFTPCTPIKTTIRITPTPERDAAAAEMNIFTPTTLYYTTKWIVANTCQGYLQPMKGMKICIPTKIIVRSAATTPLVILTNAFEMTPTHYATDINTTVNMWDITARMWKPLINIATNWNMTTPHASRPTVGNLNMTIMLLRSRIGMSSATAISTPDGINRMLTSTWRIGNMPATTITLAAPTSANGPRRLTLQALDTEMLSADVVTSGCVPVTLIAEMCLPHTARITNMNTNIPLTRILRIVPLIDNLLPRSVPELDIRLIGSSATWTISRQASMWTVTSTATINGPQLMEPLNIESTTIISPTSCSNRMTMNKWVETWTMTFVPTTMAVTMDLSVTTPMLINHMRVDSPGLLRLNNLVLRLKTLGELGRIVPVDIDLNWQKQGATWNLQLRSLHVDLASVVKLNVSIILDDTRYFVHWNIGSPRFPLWNQIMEVDLRQNSRSPDWLCSSAISNLFFWMRMNSTVSNGVIGPIMTTIGLPDSPNGLTIQWEAAQRKWILSFSDDALYRCEGIPQTSNPDQYQFTCWRAQPRQGKAPSRTTQVASWVGPNLLTPTTWVQWVPQILSFNWNKLLNQQWIANELNTICHITEPALSTRIARYISMESEKLMKKLNTDLNLEDALQMMSYMQYIPYYQPIANGVGGWNRWLKQLIGADLQTGIKTGSNWIAFQCNVTCSSCSAPVAMELRMRLDENNRPIVNTTITNSAMAIYATWTTSIPPRIVHTSVQMLNRPGHMDTHTTYSNTGPTTITADIVPANMDRVRCVGHTNDAMSILHFVCNKMQGDTVGPVITTFDLPTNWWQIFKVTTQAYMNPVSQPLSDDLYQLVEATRSFITIFDPVDAPVQSDQLQRTLKSSYNFMMAVVPYNAWDVSQMLVGIIYPAMGPEGMRIPVWRTTNPLVDMTFFVDIGTEIGISMDTSSELPLMTGTMGINLMSKNNIPMLGMISNNNLWKSTTQYNIRTMKLEGSTVVLPDITNDIKIIPVFATTGQMSGLKSNFADGEGTNYQCIATMGDPINVVCYKLEPRTPVCSFPMLTNSPIYDTMSTLWMIVPAVYTAALQPVVFKSMMRESLNFVDEHALDTLSSYLTAECRPIVNNMHTHINQMTREVLKETSLPLNEGIVTDVLMQFMLSGHPWNMYSGRYRYNHVMEDLLRSVTQNYIEPLVEVTRAVREIVEQIERMLPNMQFRLVNYDLTKNIQSAYNYAQRWYEISYMLNKAMCSPQQVAPVYFDIYDNSYLMDYIWSYFANQGARSESFFSQTSQQIITWDGQYFELPQWVANSCGYVFATDPINNQFTSYVKGNTNFVAVPGYLIEILPNRKVYITDKTGTRSQIQLPYVGDNIVCAAVNKDIGYCETADIKAYRRYLPGGMQIGQLVVKNPVYITGLMGSYHDSANVSMLNTVDGLPADDVAQFQSSFSIGGSSECVVDQRRIRAQQGPTAASQMCRETFNTPSIQAIAQSHPRYYASYLQACCDGATQPGQPCVYTDELVVEMQYMGYPARQAHSCLECSKSPQPQLDQAQLHILVSLSEQSQQLNPSNYLRSLVTKALAKYQNVGLNGKIGLITYGGRGNLYQPMMTSMDGKYLSADQDAIVNVIRQLSFTGPQYHHSSTVGAIQFAMRSLQTASSGVLKSIVIFAPESREENLAQASLKPLIDVINNDMTSLQLWSPLTPELCDALQMKPITQTGGSCVDVTQPSARDLVNSIVTQQQRKAGSRAQCSCHVKNPFTGLVENKCVLNGGITF